MNAVELLDNLNSYSDSSVDINSLETKLHQSMNDDFNTPVTIAHLFDGVKMINSINDGKDSISSPDLTKLKKLYKAFINEILGLLHENNSKNNDDQLDNVMNVVLNLRSKAKENKDWTTADLIRDELKKLNITIKDSKDASTWDYE